MPANILLPEGLCAGLAQLLQDGRELAKFSIWSAMDTVDPVGRAMARLVALRLHAWLRDGSFLDNVQESLTDLPFGINLFDSHTDSAVQRLVAGNL